MEPFAVDDIVYYPPNSSIGGCDGERDCSYTPKSGNHLAYLMDKHKLTWPEMDSGLPSPA